MTSARRATTALVAVAIAAAGPLAADARRTPTAPVAPQAATLPPAAPAVPAPPNPVPPKLRRPIKRASRQAAAAYQSIAPAAAVVFDVASGRILFQLDADRPLPIASLTKMMTALLISERHSPDEQMMISDAAASVPGSRVGVLPRGKLVPLGPVFAGMLLVSGNDAAEALAEYDSGTAQAFVARMNRRAKRMRLACTHFTTPHGLQDEGNHSCALDLAELARADLRNPWIRQIAALKKAAFPFPIKGGLLKVANNDYFVQRGLPQVPGATVTGLKTGYTDPAGRCYVVTAQVGERELGVVLLHSPDPLHQVPLLLGRAFAHGG